MTDRYEKIRAALEETLEDLRRKQRAVEHWNNLADDVGRRAELGLLDTNVAKEMADCYRRTARAIQHEIDTGVHRTGGCPMSELLPLPEGNFAHLIAAQAAEIEALRAEVDALRERWSTHPT